MVNVSHPELKETKVQQLPVAELNILKSMRVDMCSESASKDFKLQSQQRFLRRVLSPESAIRNLLMVHGTGTGKTCTAIQIAEEYIIRPEFQSKRVLVIANPSVQDNFKSQIFDLSKISIDPDGLLLSKQCTGRRYLEIIQRAQAEPLRLTDRASREKVMRLSERILSEFYEFDGYLGFSNTIDKKKLNKTPNDYNQWIHDTFDDRLIIIDEAHNLRVTTETETSKLFALAIEHIIKTAKNVTLVLLTATPMFDKFDEILYYFNLFLWNDRKLDKNKNIPVSEIFDETGQFKEDQESRFRGWCQDYISYIKGENPFTFPFRLPPPDNLIAEINRDIDHFGQPIKSPRKYLKLTKSFVTPFQENAIQKLPIRASPEPGLICVYPEYKTFSEVFERSEGQYGYRKEFEKFLAPSKIALYSSKFGLIMNILNKSTGVAFIYSNLVEDGARLFAMCLEEHGFSNAIGDNFLKNTSGEVSKGSKGKYVLFTGETGDIEIKKALLRLKARENANGDDIRIIIASPKVSEGVDFKYVRQIHVLDPWYNMSRIEQVLGRGMRTCSHALLPFEEQNCTVYLHVCRYPNSKKETLDEYIYRVFVEEKGANIARLKKVIMESAMDCDLQQGINNLPKDWRELAIPQIRSEDKKKLNLRLVDMSAPTFQDTITDLVCNTTKYDEDGEHVRPLSAILDIRDEVFDKLLKLFAKKPIWSMEDLYTYPSLKQYTKEVLDYLIQNAIESRFELKDKQGRIGILESRDGILSITFVENDTLVEKLIKEDKGSVVALPDEAPIQEITVDTADIDIVAKKNAFEWPAYASEFEDAVLYWYIVDHELNADDRIKHFLALDWNNPPIYAKNLVTKMKNGDNMYILGSKKIYNAEKDLITPIGEEQDVYMKWLNERKNSFLENNTIPFASMKEDRFSFTVDEKSTEIRRSPRTKSITPRACTSYTESILNAFSEWLSGEKFPEQVKTKKDRCIYIDLLVRRAVLNGKEGIFWVTPEELDIFDEDENRKDLLKRLK